MEVTFATQPLKDEFMADIQTIVGKMISDPAFCDQLISSPQQTLRDAGIEPTPEMLEALKELDADQMRKLAAAFGKDQVAA
jgi:hypothetical protein